MTGLVERLRNDDDLRSRIEAAALIEELVEALVEAERCIADAEVEFGCKYSGLGKVRAALTKAQLSGDE